MRGKRQRILIIGYGARGRQWHEVCRRRSDLTVLGVVDPDPAARTVAERAGLSAWSTIGEAKDAEVAIVASPPAEHVSHALICLEAGVPVLVEKPLALSIDDAARLASASARLGVPVVVGQNFRFLPRERAVRLALAEVGAPLSATIVSARPASVAAPHLQAIEHGAVWDICLHHLDALRVRHGTAPHTVAMTVRHHDVAGVGLRQHYRIVLEWPGGLGVRYEHSEGAPGFFHEEWIEGAGRAIVVRDQEVSVLFDGRRPRRVSVPREPVPEHALLDELLAAAANGQVLELGVADNLATIATVVAAIRSVTLGEPVEPAGVAELAGVQLAA